MSETTKPKRKIKKRKPFAVVDSSVRSYANDPYFVKKAEEAKAFIEKAGLPEWPPKEK